MRHWIRTSAWRFMMLMCGVLVFSGAAWASRSTAIAVTTGQNPNPVHAGNTATYTVTVTFNNQGTTCTTTLGTNSFSTGNSATFSPATVNNSAGTSATSTMTVTTSTTSATGTDSFNLTTTDSSGSGCTSISNPTGTASVVISAALPTTTTTVASSLNPSVTGGSVTFTATVTRGSGTNSPSGTVLIKDAGTTICTTGALAGGGASPTANCAASFATAATHSITAVYAGDANFQGSTSSALSQVVNKASTTTTITNAAALATASNAGAAYAVNYSVAVTAPGGGTPTGTVTVSDGTGGTCSAAVATGTCSLTSTTAGAKTITATYGGDTNYNTSVSSGVAHTVNVATTTTGLVSSANPSVVGQSVTFTATVAPIPTVGDTVTFLDGASSIGTGTTNASGVATLVTSALTLAASPHSITAVFAGDASYSTSTSSAVSQVVNKAATTTTVLAGTLSTATVVGQAYPVAFTVTVNAPGSGTVTGSDIVTVSDGVATCTATITAGTCSLASTSAGAKNITAAFPGDASYNTSTSANVAHTVNKAATSTTITTDLSAATVTGQPYTVAFTVAVTAPGAGTIPGTDTVTVSDGTGATCSGAITAGSCSLTSTTVGAKTITASFVTDANFAASISTGVAHTVSKDATTTTITSTLSTPSNAGQAYAVPFTVVANGPGAGTPTGTVTVSDGTGATCTATVAVGTCNLTSTTIGTKTVTANYPGDGNFLTSVSAGVSHQVNIGTSATALASSVNPSVSGQSVTFTATVTPLPTVGDTVTFNDNGSAIGTGTTNAAGVATLATSTLAVGTHPITAVFAGDTNFSTSTSPVVSQVVNKANTTTTITSTLTTATVTGQAYTVAYTVTATGGGTIPGTDNVTVSDGTANCTATVTAGSCSLTSTTAGAKTVTAVFAGDANFNTSTSAGKAHTVNAASTTTTITSDLSTPTQVNVPFTVAYTVVINSPGAGTIPGTEIVTVSASGDTCTGTVAAGSCQVTPTVAQIENVTATYAGDTNFATSTSAGVSHSVIQAPMIVSGASAGFSLNVPGTFTIQFTGTPNPTISETGALPSGVTLTPSISGNALLSGTPTQIGTFPIVITATNGVPPDFTQNFVLTVSNAVTYVQPFNANHGWVFQQSACSNATCTPATGSATNDTTSTDCQTQPCVQDSTFGLNLFGSGTLTGYYHNSYTWSQLGVPRGATVISVDGGFWDKTSGCNGGTASIEIYDGGNTNPVSGIINSASISGDTATNGVTHNLTGSPQSIPVTYQGAATAVTLRFDLNGSASFVSTCKINGDNFTLAISFIALNGHQVIVATDIDRDGNILSSRTVRDEPSSFERKTK